MSSPVISVIMPVYNAEKYVYEAIDSILRQTFTDFEFLIFDDGSTDSSREIILSFKDSRIRWIGSEINTGYVKHLNDGLLQAKGKYIARMDADDIAHPERFFKQINYLNQHQEVAACGSWIEFIGSKTGVLEYPVTHRDIVTHLLLFGNALAHPAVMLRKAVLMEHSLTYEASLEPAEDYELWNRISEVAQLHNLSEVLLTYRVHDRNESVVKKNKQDHAVIEIRERLLKKVLTYTNTKFNEFVCDRLPKERLTNKDFDGIRIEAKRLLASKNYNNQLLKSVLCNRLVAWCKSSDLLGYHKMIQYLRFPKHFFSIRICLSLLLNK